MARIHGKNGQVKIDPAPTVTPAPAAVASVNKWDLDMSKDLVDVTCFSDTNKQSVMGLPNFSGNLGGAWDSSTTPSQIFDVVFGTVACFLELIPNTVEATYLFKGLAYLDGSIVVDSKAAVVWTGKFAAAGNWTMVP